MLTSTKMWNLIKQNFGIPYTFFELDADQAIDYIRNYTMPYFSQYVPHKIYYYLNLEDSNNKVEDSDSEFYIHYDGTIITVADIFQDTSRVVTGHPITPILSGDVVDKIIKVQESNVKWKLSTSLNFTWEFISPNKLKLFPAKQSLSATYLILELEVAHTEFETIPGRFERFFIDLAIADIKEVLGNIRTKYQEFQTPFGTINLNADILKNEAEQMRSRVIEVLQTLPPNTHVLIS